MQMISAVVCRQGFRGMLWIAYGRFKVDHTIEGAAGTNPVVHCFSLHFSIWRGVVRAFKRRKRPADHSDSACVRTLDNLPQARNNVFGADSLIGGVRRIRESNIVDAFQHDHFMDARLHQHVAIETLERVAPYLIMPYPVAADSGVE